MKLINSLKKRLYDYIDYRHNLTITKQQFYLEANLIKGLFISTKELGITNSQIFEGKNVIVSLTTYGKRLYEVYLTIESIMQQTIKPNKIILWLAEEMKSTSIPITLQMQQKRGLEINFCKDIRSYKKLIPSLREYPNDIIITIDDDVIYNIDTIELLINSYKNNPNCVIANWALEMEMGDTMTIVPYSKWKTVKEESESKRYLPIGCAGILYPPYSLAPEVMHDDVFMDICKYGDDIWFKAMALKNGYSCYVTPQGIHEHQYYDNPLWQDKGLTQVNINHNLNDKQIHEVFNKYNLFKAL